MDDLRGRTAVVTGGGSGIGKGLCLTWAAEGMHVVVADIDESRAVEVADEVRAKGVRALPVQCDVSNAASVENLADAAYAELGAVHVLCNNAGVVQFGPVAEASQDDWDWVFAVNLWGVVNGIRTFVPRMRAQGGPAHIVNTASGAGIVASPGLGVYTASKYAVVAISETLQIELQRDGIGVSVLCPGVVNTRIGETARGTLRSPQAPRPQQERQSAYGNVKEPIEVAACVRDAVKANRLYVFSHAGLAPAFERRFAQITNDVAVAPP